MNTEMNFNTPEMTASQARSAARGLTYNDPAQGRAKHMLHETADKLLRSRSINCDQVAWMLAAIGRYLPPQSAPAVNRSREMQQYALLYELMEVTGLVFEDEQAAKNGTPPDIQRLTRKPEGLISALGAAEAQSAGNVAGGQILRQQ